MTTRIGPCEDDRVEGQNTLHDKKYIFEKTDKGAPEETLKPSPQAVNLEPGTDRPSSGFKKLEKPDTKVFDLNDSNPPEDPFV